MKIHRLLLLLPVLLAHQIAPFLLKIISFWRKIDIKEWSSFKWRNLKFPNPLGIAGGVDKNAFNIPDWWKWNAGFVEVGTVTVRAQKCNPSPLLIRDVQNKNLWNHLGFPNKGADIIKKRLLKLKRPYPAPLFLNIGKNRETSEEKASDDYIFLIQTFRKLVDGFVVNISSPNTKGLRTLLSTQKIRGFLMPIVKVAKQDTQSCHLFLKLSPDMDKSDFLYVIDESLRLGFDGWILTNTTQERPFSSSYPLEGGISGKFLKQKSLECLKWAHTHLLEKLGTERRKDYLLISVGGVMQTQDVFERLNCGADLVQVYTALVFEGPCFFQKIYRSKIQIKN